MDHDGEREREGPPQSHMMCDNTPEPLASPDLSLTETRTPSQTHELTPQAGEDEGVGDNDDEGVDEPMMKEEEEEEESEEVSSGLIRCRSPGTPTTDSSFSETGSLLDTPFSPGTSPEPASPLSPQGAAPGPSLPPHAPAEPSQWAHGVDPHWSNTLSGDADRTGPVGSGGLTCTAALGPVSSPSSPCSAGAAAAAQTNALNPSTGSTTSEPVHSPGPTCSNASPTGSSAGPLAPSTEGSASGAAPDKDVSSSVVGQLSASTETPGVTTSPCTEPPETAPHPTDAVATDSSTSAPGPTPVAAPSSASGPPPRPALMSCLQQLEHRGDDTHLPLHLHQIAEAFVIQGDYQNAVWCVQLERLYHQRLLDNLSSLQTQWESSCRDPSPSDLGPQLDALTHICQTHNRPAASAACASIELLNASTMTHDQRPPGELTLCTSGHFTEAEVEGRQRDADSRLSGEMRTARSSTGSDHVDGERPPAGEQSAGSSHAQEGGAVHTGPPITAGAGIPPATAGGMDRSNAAECQGVEGEATQENEDRVEEQEERETWDSQEDAHALEMEDKGGGEEEQARLKGEGGEAVPEETELSGIEEVVPLLQQAAVAEDNQWEVTQPGLRSQPPEEEGVLLQQEVSGKQEEQAEVQDCGAGIVEEAHHLDDQAKLITVEEVTPACGLVSILKKRSVLVSAPVKAPAKRRVRFKVADDGYDQDVGGGDSCLLLFLLCLVTVVISVGGTALYCALGDAHSTVCKDFSRNADFYVGQMQRGISQLQHWLAPGS